MTFVRILLLISDERVDLAVQRMTDMHFVMLFRE